MNLEKYCHYKLKNDYPLYNNIQILYVDAIKCLSIEELKLQYKQLYREYKIKSLTSNKEEPLISEDIYIMSVYKTPTIKSMLLNNNKYNDISSMYDELIEILENIPTKHINTLTDLFNNSIYHNYNVIAGRVAYEKIKTAYPYIDVELCPKLKMDKFIICDLQNENLSGLHLVHYPKHNTYFIGLTPEHEIESYFI